MNASPSSHDDALGVTVVIPTFRRSAQLVRAIRSVAEQTPVDEMTDGQGIRLMIVDNNPAPQEEATLSELAPLFKTPPTYLHVPKPGLSNARNAAIRAVETRYLAFLDDDMVASPNWLSALLHTAQTFEVGVVFAPTVAVMPDPDDPRNGYLRPFFSHAINQEAEGYTADVLGAGGCLIDLTRCDLPHPPFDPALNRRGGEDDILFDQLRRANTPMGWSPDAICHEIVPPQRVTEAYIRARLRKHPSSIHYLSRCAQGLGKIFWGERFSLDLYGHVQGTPSNAALDPLN